MIKFRITEEMEPELVKNDRGEWRLISSNEGCVHVYAGFGSEDILIITLAGMQDGTVSILAALSACDSPVFCLTRTMHESQAEKSLNEMLEVLLTYPEQL